MKIYTKTGDSGETSLFSGKRVSKTHSLVECFGALDELNSALGFLIFSVEKSSVLSSTLSRLVACQSEIFSIGSYLASEFTLADQVADISGWTESFENQMDKMSEELPELKNFILPGGTEQACHAHACRVLTRSVERKVVSLGYDEQSSSVVIYLNRLSDYFFMLSRYINHKMDVVQPIWKA
jgi:cob(I)alamin adenosyltransferase